jgi:hypothetical protein
VAGFSPVAAGAALLPVTLLMLALSSQAGALAQRIGPRWPMVGGTALAAVGVLMLSRIDASASYVADVLPGAILFGLGISAVVAPLTATVLAPRPSARPASRAGSTTRSPAPRNCWPSPGCRCWSGCPAGTTAHRRSSRAGSGPRCISAPGLLLAGSRLSLALVSDHVLAGSVDRRPHRRVHCTPESTPLETHR